MGLGIWEVSAWKEAQEPFSKGAGNLLFIDLGSCFMGGAVCENSSSCIYMVDACFCLYITLQWKFKMKKQG